jgi:hypothetical protein
MFSIEKRKLELKTSFLSFKSEASYFKNVQSGNCYLQQQNFINI